MGGTFNPIHKGHVYLAREFARRLGLDRVLLIPAGLPPHKEAPALASGEDRFRMCALAAKAEPDFSVCDLEIRRAGKSYTADTLSELSGQYLRSEFYLLMGADMFLTLHTWLRAQEIFDRAFLCTIPRDDITPDQIRAYASSVGLRQSRVYILDIPKIDMSSTEIRALIESGGDFEDLLPPGVADYIKEKKLYGFEGAYESIYGICQPDPVEVDR